MKIIAFIFAALIALPASAAHYAETDESFVVLRVVVVDDAVETVNGATSEANGIAWCQQFFGGGIWVKTFRDGQRKHDAGAGYTYRGDLDAFIAPKPYPSWTLDPITANWFAPVPRPNDDHRYLWDENSQTWVQVP